MLQNDKGSLSGVPNLSRAAGHQYLQSYQKEVTNKSHTVFTRSTTLCWVPLTTIIGCLAQGTASILLAQHYVEFSNLVKTTFAIPVFT